MITAAQREVARQIADGDPKVERQILARLGAASVPTAVPAPKPAPAPTPLSSLLTSGELDGLTRLASEFYGRVCTREARAMTLLDRAANALGIPSDRAVSLAHAAARLLGLRARSEPVSLASGSAVSEALMIPIFPENE